MNKYTFSQPKEYWTKKACDERYECEEVDNEIKQEVVINLDEDEEVPRIPSNYELDEEDTSDLTTL